MSIKTAFATPIDKNASLATGARAAGSLSVATKAGGEFADLYLTVHFDTTAPSAGTSIAELYLLPGNGESSEVFPQGGDGTVGVDVDPQQNQLVGVFESRSPSITTDEVLVVRGVPLGVGTDRLVVKNISGQTFNLAWQLDAVCYRI